ncbi:MULTISPECIES: hypothetical protein [unclassified Pseudomonas]|uniref:hypothetical protein n=1 Tax=unclassified Pseudomonas TaxID=196821 RepID=UPI00244D3C6F|nr:MULTISPECIES: hypothetical protein [unclassified Pseudomonas]MDG9922399.1 hypothetical protein [Pseudomonas sp. GD04045]MDH0034403.1 hypothetical protein [Pseudomonas sp. GD04019]
MALTNLNIPEVFAFLKQTDGSRGLERLITQFTLLKSPFTAELWLIEGLQYPINFNILLADNSRLTDSKNSALLLELKTWIAIQQALPENKKIQYSTEHILKRIRHVLRIIDYFLLSDEAPLLATHGVSALTGNSFKSLAHRLCTFNCVEEQFYDWSKRLRAYLIEHCSHAYNHSGLPIHPDIENFEPHRRGFSLNLTDEQIVNIRRNLYLNSTEFPSTLKNRPKNLLNPIRVALYANTLYGERLYKLPAELKLASPIIELKEKQPAPIRSKHNKIVKQNFRLYMSCIRSLENISEYGSRPPLHAEFELIASKNLRNLETSDPDRYRSVPFHVGLLALRQSIEYSLRYGPDILDATARIIIEVNNGNLDISGDHDLTPYLSDKLLLLGIKRWTIYTPTGTGNNFTEQLKASEGLYEAFLVLIGAVQVMLGLLSARRFEEIRNVRYSNLDPQSSDLIFHNGKSGIGDKRAKISRPIPPVCFKVLNLLHDFHVFLSEHNISETDAKLLSLPDRSTLKIKRTNSKGYYDVIDLFCDHAQIPLNEFGQRYYLREHQLRRFFAQAFFWSSLGNLHTLRWMLGQTDPEHIYRYISDNVPGEIFIDVKAEFVTEVLLHRQHSNPELESLVEEHFNTNRLSILLEEEVRDYIQLLIKDKTILVEPHYYYSDTGKSYDILIEVLHEDQYL